MDQNVENIDNSSWKYIWRHGALLIIIIFAVAIFAAILFPKIIHFIFFALVIGITFGYSAVYNKMKKEFFKQFGASIGFTFTDSIDVDSVQGKLFSIGRDRSISDVLTGMYQNIHVRIFCYQFIIGSGKSSQTINNTVFEATFDSSMPDLLVSSESQIQFLDDCFNDEDVLKLEGDFNKYFKVRAPKGFEVEAYQILSPDVMVDLIDKARNLNFEFNNNRLYIYVPKVVSTKSDMQSMFNLVEYIDSILKHNISEVHV